MTDQSTPGANGTTEPVPESAGDTPSLPPAPLARRIFDVNPVSTLVVDTSKHIAYANARAAETLGRSTEALTGQTFDPDEGGLQDETVDPKPTAGHHVNEVFETGDPRFGFEHRIQRPDGTNRWLSCNAAPIAEDGSTTYVVVSFEDITALKRRGEELTNEEMRRVEVATSQAAVPPTLRVESGRAQIEIDSVVSVADGATAQYMATADLSASDFVAAIEEVPHYEDVRLLSTVEGYSRIEAKAEAETAMEIFSTLGGRPHKIVVSQDEVRFIGEIPGDVDPQLVVEGIQQFHADAKVVSQDLVYTPHLLYDIVEGALTDQQFASLHAAYYGGYFETPRASTGNELASQFEITRQTFNQHLRKAQQSVFQHLFEKSGTDVP